MLNYLMYQENRKMSTKFKFSGVHGENVDISKDKSSATWIPKTSDGWACSETELKPGDTVDVKIEGNGRCDIGFMKDEQSDKRFKTLHEIRSHRKVCCIEVSFNENGDEVSSKFGDRISRKKLKKKTKVWLAIFIRYGEMSVEMSTIYQPQMKQKFSSSKHGSNIRLEDDNTMAISVCKNPASICYISEKIEVGETIHLNCAPEKEGDRQPLQYELKVHVYENDPIHLKEDYKHLFEASDARRSDLPLTTIETFERDECNGQIAITISDTGTVQYKTARGKQNTQTLSIGSKNGVWVVLDLYRVKVKLNNSQEIPETPNLQDNSILVPNDELDNSLSHAQANAGEDQLDSLSNAQANAPEILTGGTDSRAEGGNEDVVRYLAGRVINLEQELQTIKFRDRVSVMPRPMSCPDMNILANDTGEELNVQKRFPDLVRSIDTMNFCDHLYAKNVMTDVQMDAIHAIFNGKGSTEANRELLKLMKTKRIEKSLMVEILEETQQQHLLEMFYPPINTMNR